MRPQHRPSGPTPRAAAAAALRARVGMVLDRGMVEARISAKALSALLQRDHHDHIDEKIVSDYRRGRTLLPLHLAQQVARGQAIW